MRQILVVTVVLIFTQVANAKFSSAYIGIASDAVNTCTQNMTRAQFTDRDQCRPLLVCIMNSFDNYENSIISAGSSILGFIPTVMALVGNTNDDLVRVHGRFPLLALLLSVTSINTLNARLSGLRSSSARGNGGKHTSFSSSKTSIDSDSNGVTHPQEPYPGLFRKTIRPHRWYTVLPCYLVAAAGAGGIVWQTYDLGQKAVVSWACWTSMYPGIWVSISVLQHLIAVISLRLCLQRTPSPQPFSTAYPALPFDQTRPSTNASKIRSRYAWDPILVREDTDWEIRHREAAYWSKAAVELLSNLNFVYGTIVYSSLTLVSGKAAVQVVCVYGFAAVATRLVVAWVLED